MRPLRIGAKSFHYKAMIGVGGTGGGSFFALSGNHTLGREESRGGRFLDRKDYCKLHIISHYVRTLLGSEFAVIPIGKVGDDEVGKRLFAEMEEAGLDMRYVKSSPGDQTLFSFCFVYPDGSGGNMTTDDSACSKVDPEFVAQAEPEFGRFEGKGIVLAVPEVPLEARQALLELGTRHGFFRVASFTSEEIPAAIESGVLRSVDLLAINIDEAAIAAGISSVDKTAEAIAEAAVARLREINPKMLVSITAGANGSWAWDGSALSHATIYKTNAVSTAGAGDAHLSGVIAGLVAGLPMAEAQRLGALVGALSVTSPHTINKEICRDTLRDFAAQTGADIPNSVKELLEG
ncbi:MAG: carbohydrate kinase family protein [Armatimonadota bacterium]|nr:carbohydrate kinase family protein [Armatimonadota bacterium]